MFWKIIHICFYLLKAKTKNNNIQISGIIVSEFDLIMVKDGYKYKVCSTNNKHVNCVTMQSSCVDFGFERVLSGETNLRSTKQTKLKRKKQPCSDRVQQRDLLL